MLGGHRVGLSGQLPNVASVAGVGVRVDADPWPFDVRWKRVKDVKTGPDGRYALRAGRLRRADGAPPPHRPAGPRVPRAGHHLRAARHEAARHARALLRRAGARPPRAPAGVRPAAARPARRLPRGRHPARPAVRSDYRARLLPRAHSRPVGPRRGTRRALRRPPPGPASARARPRDREDRRRTPRSRAPPPSASPPPPKGKPSAPARDDCGRASLPARGVRRPPAAVSERRGVLGSAGYSASAARGAAVRVRRPRRRGRGRGGCRS
jgi:hypothetical protein